MNGEQDDFFVGVNLPWLTYGCDFGANGWQPDGGVGRPERLARVQEVFERLADAELRHVRWFVLCDGRAGVRFDEHDMPQGLDRFVFRDLDAALAAAARNGLSLTLVLFDFLWCARRRTVNGVRLGGRRKALGSQRARGLLLDRVIRPLLQRYGHEPAIATWDLFNEPEWATLGYGALNPLTSLCPRRMRVVLRDLVQLVRSETRHPVTVGLASHRGLRLLEGIELDLYQVHWYDRRSPFLAHSPGGWRGKPLLLGEFPTSDSRKGTLEILQAAKERGYCGAFGWSALAADPHSHLEALEEAVGKWRA